MLFDQAALRRVLASALLLLVTACGSEKAQPDNFSLEEYRDFVSEARACVAGESCAVAGSGQCTCPTPVNAERAAEVDRAAAAVDCAGLYVSCPAVGQVACVDGRCTED